MLDLVQQVDSLSNMEETPRYIRKGQVC